jgi:pyruvate-ferredoxin/flavodoxin oxidoreductase
MYRETRFKMVEKMNQSAAGDFLGTAAHTAQTLYKRYVNLHEHYQPSEEA